MLNLYDKLVMDATGTGGTTEKKYLKHLGVLKEDRTPVVILFRIIPNDPNYCLVLGPKFLNESYRTALMRALESDNGQAAFEFGEYMNTLKFPDGMNMLEILHVERYIKKFSTKDIIVTYGPDKNGEISLDQLNQMIADDMGISVKELAIKPEKSQEPLKRTLRQKRKKNDEEATKE